MKPLGIMGGGQLARMMALAALPLGLRCVFVDPAPDACAGDVGELLTADWSDPDALIRLQDCQAITCDFENVPAEVMAELAKHTVVRPGAKALAMAQDRWLEKTFLQAQGIAVAPCQTVDTRPDLLAALDALGYPAVLKSRRLGYDGKGQQWLHSPEDLEPAWQALGGQALILEGAVAFSHECALTAVRAADGDWRAYPLSHTVHQHGILVAAMAPSSACIPWQAQAEQALRSVMEALDYVGVLTLEFFVTDQGLVANELAPRVHNSGHWTIEGAVCSQFENHVRAVMAWPLGDTSARGQSLMLNVIGAHITPREPVLAIPGLHWHDYGKAARAGRKLGHLTLNVDQLQRHHLQPLLDLGLVQEALVTGLINAAG